jgi:hypothetical protein
VKDDVQRLKRKCRGTWFSEQRHGSENDNENFVLDKIEVEIQRRDTDILGRGAYVALDTHTHDVQTVKKCAHSALISLASAFTLS